VPDQDYNANWLLQFDGIDTIANITWNGKHLGKAESMFLRYIYIVTPDFLDPTGINTLEVTIKPGELTPLLPLLMATIILIKALPTPTLNHPSYFFFFFSFYCLKLLLLAMEYTADAKASSPYEIPEVVFYNTWPKWAGKNFLRKTSSDFGWDWGPAFVPAGIIGDVTLFKSSIGELEDVLVKQTPVGDDVTLTVTTIMGSVPLLVPFLLEIDLLDEKGDKVVPTILHAKQLVPGENTFTHDIIVPKPTLWWPVGLGKPTLYKLTVTAKYGNGVVSQTKTKNVGFRTIKVVEEPIDGSDGLSFYFEVNGVPVYSKGANLIPFHVFLNQRTTEEMEWILQSSVEVRISLGVSSSSSSSGGSSTV